MSFFSGDKVLSSDSSTLSGVTSTSRDSGSSQEVFYNLPDRHAGLISEPPEPPRFRNLRNFVNWEPRFFSWAFCVVSVKNTTFFWHAIPGTTQSSGPLFCFTWGQTWLCIKRCLVPPIPGKTGLPFSPAMIPSLLTGPREAVERH